jgi:hypothetical protein
MPIKNFTTVIPARRSVSEIQELLSNHGALSIAVRNERRVPVEITFVLPTNDGEQEFVVPADIEGVLRSIRRDAGSRGVPLSWVGDRVRATDIAWRIVKDWIAATCAILEAGLAEPQQAFLAYATALSGRSVYEELRGRSSVLALPPGQEAAQ